MTVRCRPADPDEREGVVATLAEAFFDDPVMTFLFDDPSTRLTHLTALFRAQLGASAADVELLVAPDLTTAALWVPHLDPDRPDESGEAMGRTIMAALGEEVGGARLAALAPLGEAHPRTPHWYLALVGTRSVARRRGQASAVIEAVTARCDEQGLPAYLESSHPDNVPLYRSHGFVVTAEVAVEGGPTVPLMWREPR